MARPKKVIKTKEPVRIRFKELTNGNKSIYLDIYRNGKRTYEFLKLYIVPELDPASKALNEHCMALANKVKADRIIELTNSEKGVSNATLRAKMKLETLFDSYSRWLEENDKTSSLRCVKTVKKVVAEYRGDNVTIQQVDKDFCIGFMNFLHHDYKGRKGAISATTATDWVAILSATLNWAVRNEYIRENPFDKIASSDRIHRPESKRQFLQIDEIKNLSRPTVLPVNPSSKHSYFPASAACG